MKAAWFWSGVGALLCAMGAVEFFTARNESQTWDESNQLLSGYVYLITGRFTVALEQPPLAKLLWAVPVALLRPDPPPAVIRAEDPWPAGLRFLYHNRVPADAMLMAGRSCAIAISVVLGVAVAFFAKRYFGAVVALAAVFLYAADPNFLAHGRYMKNDVAAALTIFGAVMIWGDYLARPARSRLWISGAALGLALATKDSALVLLPVMLILYAIREWQQRRPLAIALCVRRFAIAGLAAFLVIFIVYGFELRPVGQSGVFRRFFPAAGALAQVPVPALGYFTGLGTIWLKQTVGGLESGYVLGEPALFGRWYTSPVALAVKTPLADLILFALAAALAAMRLRSANLRGLNFRWYLFLVPPAIYAAVSLFTSFNAGIRHLLPLYPFLFVAAIAIVLRPPVRRWRAASVLAVSALLLIETAGIYPHYLAFFNALAGGPVGGRRVLVDSNLDWGQDVKNLKAWLREHAIDEVAISYYGMADLAYYGIHAIDLPQVPDVSSAQKLDCVAAISATNLALHRRRYAGLEALQPSARIGYSIYVYDLRKHGARGGQ
jgi:4-amino-4-deoxy-L-arabinose transferase-like glycosyltransferase